VAMSNRSPLLPDVPTVGEVGLAGMEAAVLLGISTTGGTPAALVERLNAVVNEALADEGVRQKLQELGFIPIGGTAAFYATSLAEETAKWRKVIKDSNIPPH
jgi:tripartite-type tricarboxylate transporter receptor subunit TctC